MWNRKKRMNEPLIARDLTLQSFVRRALRVRSDLALEIDCDCLFIANIIVLLVSDIFIYWLLIMWGKRILLLMPNLCLGSGLVLLWLCCDRVMILLLNRSAGRSLPVPTQQISSSSESAAESVLLCVCLLSMMALSSSSSSSSDELMNEWMKEWTGRAQDQINGLTAVPVRLKYGTPAETSL